MGEKGRAEVNAARPTLAAVVFDFDGVIADTEPLHCKAFAEVLRPLGISLHWEEYRREFLGFDDRDAFRAIHRQVNRPIAESEVAALVSAKADAFEHLAEREGAPLYPGIEGLIRELKGRIPLALCSGALLRDIRPILARNDLASVFDVMVTADDVSTSKPDPTSYRLVVQQLSQRHGGRPLEPEGCVAIEDTPAGIAAAQGAGLRVLAVATTYPAMALGAADRLADSPSRVTRSLLEQVARGIVI